MIHITGDTHGEQARFRELYEQGEKDWDENDILIVTGDFGYIFSDDAEERLFLKELEKKPYTICFCDGNHENFPAIAQYPCEEWNGGKVHRICKNILHLMRGQVYTIEGKTFFTMGGAYSIDRYMRREGYSFWCEELPSEEEYSEAIRNLKAHAYRVDYIITHTASTKTIIDMLSQLKKLTHEKYMEITHARDLRLTDFFEWIRDSVSYTKWFFGHWHEDTEVDERHRAIYFDMETI